MALTFNPFTGKFDFTGSQATAAIGATGATGIGEQGATGATGPAGADGTGSPVYGEASKMTSGTIAIGTQGTYQSTGLTATLASFVDDIVLGTTDTFALKNASGATRRMSVFASYDASTAGAATTLGLILALNGTPLTDTECRATTSASGAIAKLQTSWILDLADDDEIALFVANHSSTTQIDFQRGRIIAQSIAGFGPQGSQGATGATGPATKTLSRFTAMDNQPPDTTFATLDTRNSIAIIDFDDSTDESAVFVSIIPEAAILGSGLKIRLIWTATTATSGDCVWDAALERMNTDIDTDSFDTASSVTTTTNGTSGVPNYSEITLTTIDSVVVGDGFRLKITRDANNGSDTMTGDAELIAVEIQQIA